MTLPRSKKKRIIKKWYKRTGWLKFSKRDYVGMVCGLHSYVCPSYVWIDKQGAYKADGNGIHKI
jgi:hypothetical protein